MELNYREVGAGEPVLVVHGLFGTASNWQSIAKRLADRWRVFLVDLRNHGDSPHHEDMSYAAMASDLAGFIDTHCQGRAPIIGHSMGGKAAMTLALSQPRRVSALVAADVAPVAYRHRFTAYVQALAAIDLESLERRRDADTQLANTVPEPGFRAFLLNNLRQRPDGAWYWRANLGVLASHVDDVAGFPAAERSVSYPGKALFLHGANSTYLRDDHWPEIMRLFPRAIRETVAQAGHWLHAEQPDAVAAHLRTFLVEAS